MRGAPSPRHYKPGLNRNRLKLRRMEPMRLVSLNLPADLIAAIGRAARDAGKTPQDMVRAALQHVFAGEVPGQAVRGREGLAAWNAAAKTAGPPLQSAPDAAATACALSPGTLPFTVHLAFAEALGWLDLQSRLRATGFVLRLGAGGVLALHTWPADHRLLDSADIGQPLADLTLRFRAAFPGQVPVIRQTDGAASPRPHAGRKGRLVA